MTIFNKCHAVFVGFLAFIIVTTVGYTINQGDFFQNEHIFIIAKTFLISLKRMSLTDVSFPSHIVNERLFEL